MTDDEHKLAIDRARIEGQRMAHLADKVASDSKNFREAAAMLPSTPRGKAMADYLNGLADRLEQKEPKAA